jgi:hypothetical protein
VEKSTSLGVSRRQAPTAVIDAVVADDGTGRHSNGAAPMSADVAYRGLTFLTPTLRLPKGTHYVVRRPDDDSLIVYLVSDRKWKQWPRWKRISSLIPFKRIVEEAHPGTHVPQRRLYF